MNDELMRRIEAALDSESGIEADRELRASLARDPEAASYARTVERLDRLLGGLAGPPERDWDALADAIDARLDQAPAELDFDPLAPVRFVDDAAQNAPSAPTPVSDLAARRKRLNPSVVWIGALAAAAAVGLGIVIGTTTYDRAAPEAVAVAPSAVEEAEGFGGDFAPMRQEPLPEPAPASAAAPAASAAARSAPIAPEFAALERAPLEQQERLDQARAPREEAVRASSRPAGAPRLEPSLDGIDVPADRIAASPAPTVAPAGASVDRDAPARPQVIHALARALEPVQQCIGARREVAQVTVDVGADGAIQTVAVSPFTGADAACIERAVRSVQMPNLGEPYRATHAFRPAPFGASGVHLAPAAPPPAARHRAARRAAENAAEAIAE